MSEKWSEQMIARAVSIQILQRKCIVLLPNTTWNGAEADVLGVTMDMRLIDVEVKISRADLKREMGKDKWWIRHHTWGQAGPEQLLGFPPKVWKHYFALPAEIWKPQLEDILPSPNSGILLLDRSENTPSGVAIHCVRRATPNRDCSRLTPEDALDVARLANIRMWESYALLESEQRRRREIESQLKVA